MSPRSVWEYNFTFFSNERELASIQEALNELGRDGWELATVIESGVEGKVFIFKQPVG